jgi:hypothetical protein
MPNIQLAQAQAPYQRGTLREVPIGVKPPEAASEPVPGTPAEKRYQAPPQTQSNWQFPTPPQMPPKSPRYLAAEQEKLNPMNSPSQRQTLQDIIAAEEQARKEVHDQQMKAWESKNTLTANEYAKERERMRDAAKIEVEQQEREQKRQQSNYAERIQRHLGGRDPAVIEQNLYKSRASVASVPAIVQSLQRTNAVVDKMYTGPTADVNTFLSQILPGFDPAKGAATQQFKTAMTDIMAAHRAAVVGPGSQSGPELKLLQQSTAADAKLNVDTIKEALAAAERLMVKTAIAHQKEVRSYAGDFDPDRTRSVYSSFEVPGMIDVVPQRTINKLMQHQDNPQVWKDFDDTYHTPGLAEKIIQREMLRTRR